MKTWVVVGAALAASVALTSCGMGGIGGATERKENTYEVTEKVLTLKLNSGASDAVVTETDRVGVKVTESLYWRKSAPKAEHTVEGETLAVSYDCKSDMWGSCGVNYRVEVPKGMKVILDAGSGDVTLRNLSGELEASLGSGDVTSSALTSKKVLAENGSGNIELKFTGIPDSLKVETGSGDTTLVLPKGAYDLSKDIGSGDLSVDVTVDGSSPHKVSVLAGSGNVSLITG